MYLGLRMKHEQQPFTNDSRCIAIPVLGFLSGKCRAAPITLRGTRDQGPPAVPGASRLVVLPVAARRWVLTDNTIPEKHKAIFGYSL
jgi:hypothetical protein